MAKRISDSGYGQDRPDAGNRIARRDQHPLRRSDRFEDTRRRLGLASAGEANRGDRILKPALDEIFFKAQLPDRSFDTGLNALIAHRKNSRSDDQSLREDFGDLGKGFSFAEQLGAHEVRGEVAVAHAEPGRLA